MAYVPSNEGSSSVDSPQDASPSPGPSIYKEQPSVEPSFAVEKYNDKDDAGYITTWRIRLHRLLPLTSLSAIAAYWLYLTLRVRYTVAAQHVRHTVYPMAWIFLAIEAGVACESSNIPWVPFHGCHFHACLLMRESHSAISASATAAILLVQDSPPPQTSCRWRTCPHGRCSHHLRRRGSCCDSGHT